MSVRDSMMCGIEDDSLTKVTVSPGKTFTLLGVTPEAPMVKTGRAVCDPEPAAAGALEDWDGAAWPVSDEKSLITSQAPEYVRPRTRKSTMPVIAAGRRETALAPIGTFVA